MFGCSTAREKNDLRDALQNITYPSNYTSSGRAPLIDGRYEEPAAPGSAAKLVVRLTDLFVAGAIGGRDVAALVLVTDPGGSGVFFDLYVLEQSKDGWIVADHAFLGDRVRVHDVRIEQERIGLHITVHGPGDPVCCPTRPTRVQYALKDGRLVKVDALANPTAISPIEGQVWTWQHTVRSDGSRTTAVEFERDTLHPGPWGQPAVPADGGQMEFAEVGPRLLGQCACGPRSVVGPVRRMTHRATIAESRVSSWATAGDCPVAGPDVTDAITRYCNA